LPTPFLDAFDPESLRLPATDWLPVAPAKPPRHRPGEPFLKGPIPWPWIVQAARLPGKALAIGLTLWREAGCQKRRTVPLNLSATAAALGMGRKTAMRGLRALGRAGLVKATHAAGRCLTVDLLDAPEAGAGPTGANGQIPANRLQPH
jgi:hypothetical protein